MQAREAAYLALLASMQQEGFVIHRLEQWQQKEHPTPQEFSFAYEIAAGSARMALALDYIAAQLSSSKKLNLKLKERALLRTAIYQRCFMDKAPLYAIVNETVELAKKYCHLTFVGYLNALLRNLEGEIPSLPTGDSPKELSVRYSYPPDFVAMMAADYGITATKEIFKAGNSPPRTMVRVRPGVDLSMEAFKFLDPLKEAGLPIAILNKAASLSTIAESPEIYIQNATPVALVAGLAERTTQTPSLILDLCASPGGKLLAAHDLYPKARLFANDVSEEKLFRLSQNLAKYRVSARLSCYPGEEYPADKQFDLIILDVPCSNSGVLNKRPEARWRLTKDAVETLQQKQIALLEHAVTLLSERGAIWYLTCSILKKENEEVVARISQKLDMALEYTKVILPNLDGWDGGFACLLTHAR